MKSVKSIIVFNLSYLNYSQLFIYKLSCSFCISSCWDLLSCPSWKNNFVAMARSRCPVLVASSSASVFVVARKPTASHSPPAGIKAGDIWQGVGRWSPGAGLRSALELRCSSGSCRSLNAMRCRECDQDQEGDGYYESSGFPCVESFRLLDG